MVWVWFIQFNRVAEFPHFTIDANTDLQQQLLDRSLRWVPLPRTTGAKFET